MIQYESGRILLGKAAGGEGLNTKGQEGILGGVMKMFYTFFTVGVA